jgi:hypothetical protein
VRASGRARIKPQGIGFRVDRSWFLPLQILSFENSFVIQGIPSEKVSALMTVKTVGASE